MTYYRDPLLDKICDRINGLQTPAFIKNSELVFVACNSAFTDLFELENAAVEGTTGDSHELETIVDIGDKERACLVFGEDQTAAFEHPFGKGRFRVEMERFILSDGETYLYCVFAPIGRPAETREASNPGIYAAEIGDRAPTPFEKTGLGRAQIEQCFDMMDIAILVTDSQNRLVYFNNEMKEMYRGTVDNLQIGMTVSEIVELAYDSHMRTNPAKNRADPEVRRRWIEDKARLYQPLDESVTERHPNGRWIKRYVQRIPEGGTVGLRVDVTDMKMQEELHERHVEEIGLFREMFKRLPVPTFARDADQKLAYANPAYAELFGRELEDLIGTTEQELLGERAEKAFQINRNTLAEGGDFESEGDILVADDRIASTLVKGSRLFTAKGKPYIVGTIVDISAMRERERQLQRAMENAEQIRRDLTNIVSSVDVCIVVLDTDLNVHLANSTYMNKIWTMVENPPRDSLVGMPYREILTAFYNSGLHPNEFATLDEYCVGRIEELRSGKIAARELCYEDGTVCFYSGVVLSDGKILLTYFDLTEMRKRDAEALAAHQKADMSNRLVRNATDTMAEGLLILENERIVFANPGLATIIGLPPEALEVGVHWEEVYRKTAAQNKTNSGLAAEAAFARFRSAMSGHRDISYNFPLNEDRWVHVDMRCQADGQKVILCSDHTATMKRESELRRLIARAETADRAKSEFLANMSLEIRTPMNGILGMAELLRKSNLDAHQKAFLDIIIKSGHALLTIMNDILDFTRLDAGHLELKYTPFDPLAALEDVATLFAPKAFDKGIELIVDLSGDIPAQIMGDGGRFRQIVNILISNAVKFTDSGHVIAHITACGNGHGQTLLSISVQDTGMGIQADRLASVFDKFSGLEITSNQRDGTGLSLAIAQKLANMQGGAIAVDSTEGQGSTFTLTVPFNIAVKGKSLTPLPANVAGARILFIERHDLVRHQLLSHSNTWGFECVDAHDAATGLAILNAAVDDGIPVDVVVIGHQLPDMGGPELIRQIRLVPSLSGVATVLMTTQDLATANGFVEGLEVDACMMKPTRLHLLRETLIDVIRPRRTHASLDVRRKTYPPQIGSNVLDLHRPAVDQVISPVPHKESALRSASMPFVLVAEDNVVNQLFFTQILMGAGARFRVVGTGEEAIEAWLRETPDIIIMDTAMPVIDGFEATRRIRAMEAETGGHTPIIGVTTNIRDDEAEFCIASGMDDHVTKPVSPERLEEKIRHWTARHQVSLAR